MLNRNIFIKTLFATALIFAAYSSKPPFAKAIEDIYFEFISPKDQETITVEDCSVTGNLENILHLEYAHNSF